MRVLGTLEFGGKHGREYWGEGRRVECGRGAFGVSGRGRGLTGGTGGVGSGREPERAVRVGVGVVVACCVG